MVEDWLLGFAKLQCVFGLGRFHMMKNTTELSVAKITDDLLLAGVLGSIESVSNFVSSRLTVRETINTEPILFNACKTTKHSMGSETPGVQHYLSEVAFCLWKKAGEKLTKH